MSPGIVHVWAYPDEILDLDEFVCSAACPFRDDMRDHVAVVYHPESVRLGMDYACKWCHEHTQAQPAVLQ